MPNATVEYIGDDGVTRKMEFTEDIEPRAITNFFEKYLVEFSSISSQAISP